jgi:hypothetical protein
VLLLRGADAVGHQLLRMLFEQEVVMRIRRALLLAAGCLLLPAIAFGQT